MLSTSSERLFCDREIFTVDDDELLFQDDELLFAEDDDAQDEGLKTSSDHWRMLVVDDDESVLLVTKMALRDFTVSGRPVKIYTAESLKSAQEFLRENHSMAVVITDVVMETEQAGLELVEWVRGQTAFEPIRLVIRTGEPGAAPPEQVLGTLDINDYWPKTEITPHRMRTILTGLIRSFRDINDLRDQKQMLQDMQAKLVQQERLKVLGEIASGVVHDFRNVLTPITAYSSMLHTMPDLPERDRQEFVELIYQASQDAAKVVDRLQRDYLGKKDASDREAFDLATMLGDTAALARPKLNARNKALGARIELDVDCDEGITLVANAAELRQGLLNLAMNALDAMTASGRIVFRGSVSEGGVLIEVSDTGSGMDENTLAQCKSAFFTTKGENGTGLGLATTVNTIKSHGGTLDIASELGRGTLISIRLPS